MSQNFTISKIIKDESAFNQEKRNKDKEARGYQNHAKGVTQKYIKRKRKISSQQIGTCGSEKMTSKLQIHGKFLITINIIIVLNAEKKRQLENL